MAIMGETVSKQKVTWTGLIKGTRKYSKGFAENGHAMEIIIEKNLLWHIPACEEGTGDAE